MKNTETRRPRADSFGLTADDEFFTVDTGGGLIFKIRRLDYGSHTKSPGDIASLVYNGLEYQDSTRGSQINSGFDYLYQGISDVSVDARHTDTDFIKVTVTAGDLTHYYLARRGEPRIYMATIFSREPDAQGGVVRYIVRALDSVLPDGPTPSRIKNNTGAIESGDIFGMANGETRSKHYSNQRQKDWSYIGATGNQAGLWIVASNTEGMSGGPFYRCLLNQNTSTSQEITYIINYGEAQTEEFRFNILNLYTLVFTDGSAPPATIDISWLSRMALKGWVGPSGRGKVAGVGILGMDPSYAYTVGFSSAAAQYWTTATAGTGYYVCDGMLPGDYTMNIYKHELVVATRPVTVRAGEVTRLHTVTITDDPSSVQALWRTGDWSGSPEGLLNGDKVTTMHPSDVRMNSWLPGIYIAGTTPADTGFPAYQWVDVNNGQQIQFTLRADQIAGYQLRIGITTNFAGGRPRVDVNGWTSAIPSPPEQPKTRTLTIGSYRGNNIMYKFDVPSSAFIVGENIVTINVVSGTSGSQWLSPGFSYDAVDLIRV